MLLPHHLPEDRPLLTRMMTMRLWRLTNEINTAFDVPIVMRALLFIVTYCSPQATLVESTD